MQSLLLLPLPPTPSTLPNLYFPYIRSLVTTWAVLQLLHLYTLLSTLHRLLIPKYHQTRYLPTTFPYLTNHCTCENTCEMPLCCPLLKCYRCLHLLRFENLQFDVSPSDNYTYSNASKIVFCCPFVRKYLSDNDLKFIFCCKKWGHKGIQTPKAFPFNPLLGAVILTRSTFLSYASTSTRRYLKDLQAV